MKALKVLAVGLLSAYGLGVATGVVVGSLNARHLDRVHPVRHG